MVDTSAVAAIFFKEPEAEIFETILLANEPAISAGTVIELYRVSQLALGNSVLDDVETFFADYSIRLYAVDADQVKLAREGMLRFGKGRGVPPAALNFGDLFAYALARKLSAPLLFKGSDFAMTDVAPDVAP